MKRHSRYYNDTNSQTKINLNALSWLKPCCVLYHRFACSNFPQKMVLNLFCNETAVLLLINALGLSTLLHLFFMHFVVIQELPWQYLTLLHLLYSSLLRGFVLLCPTGIDSSRIDSPKWGKIFMLGSPIPVQTFGWSKILKAFFVADWEARMDSQTVDPSGS